MIPYSDNYLHFDEVTGQYILTEEALVVNGTDLRARLEYNMSVNATAIIGRHLRRVSDVIYNFIHSFSNENDRQNHAIQIVPSLRVMIYRAMIAQSEYMLLNGDLSRSVEKEKRELAVDMNARQILERTNPDLGTSILYAGCY
jgi:hypothetical protein